MNGSGPRQTRLIHSARPQRPFQPKKQVFSTRECSLQRFMWFRWYNLPGKSSTATMACPPVPFGGPFVDRRFWHGSNGPWVGGMGNGAQLDLRRLRSRVSPSWAVWSRAGHQSDTQARRPRGLGRWTMRSSTEAQTAICEVETQTVLCERPLPCAFQCNIFL